MKRRSMQKQVGNSTPDLALNESQIRDKCPPGGNKSTCAGKDLKKVNHQSGNDKSFDAAGNPWNSIRHHLKCGFQSIYSVELFDKLLLHKSEVQKALHRPLIGQSALPLWN